MNYEKQYAQARKSLRKYRNKVAVDFQMMVRAEAGAKNSLVTAVLHRCVTMVRAVTGAAACVTCGTIYPWSGGEMHAGHFLPGRSQSILFDPRNCHPQCCYCNTHGGYPQQYKMYMIAEYGSDVVEELYRLKHQVKSWTADELVVMRMDYKERIRAAKKKMGEK
jgi:hypothetical protein